MTIENSSQIIDTEKQGSFLQVAMQTRIRNERRRAVLVAKALIAVTGLEIEVSEMSKGDIDKVYEGLEDIPGDPKVKIIQ